jgi:hypothetical protein
MVMSQGGRLKGFRLKCSDLRPSAFRLSPFIQPLYLSSYQNSM